MCGTRSHRDACSLLIAIVISIAPFAISGCASSQADREHAELDGGNKPAPSRAIDPGLVDLDGKPLNLSAQEPSPVTVTIFTRTDCPISNRFAPEVRRLHEEFHPRGVQFYLVYVDPNQAPDAIRRHVNEFQYPCRAARDTRHSLVKRCGATITPEAAVFDSSGNVVYLGRINDLYVQLGQARSRPTTRDLADAIEATLQNKPAPQSRTEAVGCIIADLNP